MYPTRECSATHQPTPPTSSRTTKGCARDASAISISHRPLAVRRSFQPLHRRGRIVRGVGCLGLARSEDLVTHHTLFACCCAAVWPQHSTNGTITTRSPSINIFNFLTLDVTTTTNEYKPTKCEPVSFSTSSSWVSSPHKYVEYSWKALILTRMVFSNYKLYHMHVQNYTTDVNILVDCSLWTVTSNNM